MNPDQWKDARSTGRKQARRVLDKLGVPHICGARNHGTAEYGCGKKESDGWAIDANHRNKNIKDNDPVNLEWLCRSCHALYDRATDKGVSAVENEFGY